jgi:5-methylcytosine-specific restriction endonuclease McrA
MGGKVSSGSERPSADVSSADADECRRAGSGSRPALIEPLAPARYLVKFTASAELRDKLERLRALMRHSVPDGDLAAIIETAVTEKLERLESRRFGRARIRKKGLGDHHGVAATAAGAAGSGPGDLARGQERTPEPKCCGSGEGASRATRHIPAEVRRAVYERDGDRCRYASAQGRRCTAREGLEFHHRHPFGLGGEHSVGQISLVCRAHNRYLAEVDYGRKATARHRRSRPSALDLTPPSP